VGGRRFIEELKVMALQQESSGCWEEEIDYVVDEPNFYLGEATAALFTQPEECCSVQLAPGTYRVQAAWLQDHAVFKFCRKE
jgi:hypothetical protein